MFNAVSKFIWPVSNDKKDDNKMVVSDDDKDLEATYVHIDGEDDYEHIEPAPSSAVAVSPIVETVVAIPAAEPVKQPEPVDDAKMETDNQNALIPFVADKKIAAIDQPRVEPLVFKNKQKFVIVTGIDNCGLAILGVYNMQKGELVSRRKIDWQTMDKWWYCKDDKNVMVYEPGENRVGVYYGYAPDVKNFNYTCDFFLHFPVSCRKLISNIVNEIGIFIGIEEKNSSDNRYHFGVYYVNMKHNYYIKISSETNSQYCFSPNGKYLAILEKGNEQSSSKIFWVKFTPMPKHSLEVEISTAFSNRTELKNKVGVALVFVSNQAGGIYYEVLVKGENGHMHREINYALLNIFQYQYVSEDKYNCFYEDDKCFLKTNGRDLVFVPNTVDAKKIVVKQAFGPSCQDYAPDWPDDPTFEDVFVSSDHTFMVARVECRDYFVYGEFDFSTEKVAIRTKIMRPFSEYKNMKIKSLFLV